MWKNAFRSLKTRKAKEKEGEKGGAGEVSGKSPNRVSGDHHRGRRRKGRRGYGGSQWEESQQGEWGEGSSSGKEKEGEKGVRGKSVGEKSSSN